MSSRWRRWRGYLDELEEVARVCGAQIAEAEHGIAARFERPAWPRNQQNALPKELVRRALDIPFLRELVHAAWEVSPEQAQAPADPSLRRWEDGEEVREVPSDRRGDGAGELPTLERRGPPPARLRAAERALAGRTRSLAVVLERLTNPRNVSAVLRTAEVLGLQEVHIIRAEGRERLLKTITTRCDRFLDLTWYRRSEEATARLRQRGYRILAADYGPGARPLDEVELGDKVAVVLGSEQLGVSPEMRAAADGLFYIPTSGFVSYLNVSAAAAMSLYELDRRMRQASTRDPLGENDRAALRRSWFMQLAGSEPERRRAYLSWVDDPPPPSPAVPLVPSREKAAELPPD